MICSSAYKRHQKICSKEPALKRAWIAKNASERQAWYRERYEEGSLGKGVKRSYDIVASETDEQSRMQDFRKLVFYEPFSAFEDRYIAVGRDGAFIRQLWRDRMSDPANFPRKMIGNVMHLGRYLGPMVVNHLCMCVGHWGGEEDRWELGARSEERQERRKERGARREAQGGRSEEREARSEEGEGGGGR